MWSVDQIIHSSEQSGVADWLRAVTYNYNSYIQYFHKNRSFCGTLFWDWNEIESTDEFCLLLWLSNRNICDLYTLKKIGFFPNPSKRFCRCEKASNWVETSKKAIKNFYET